MRRVLRRYATDGRAVLVSSHLLAEVEQTCTHVVVLHKGEVVAAGPVDDIVGDSPSVQFDVSDAVAATAALERAGVLGVSDEGRSATGTGTLVVDLDGTSRADAVAALVHAGVGVDRVVPRRRLEDAFLALVGGDTVASEASWGSLRYLLAVPVPRARLLGSKLLVSLFSCAVALVTLTGTALVAGTLRYGWHPLRTTVAGDVPAGTALVRLVAIVGYLAVSLLVVASLAFLLSVSTDAPLGAVGGAVLLQILSSILDQITALGNLRLILPTHYASAWLGLLSSPVQTDDMVKGVISALAYATLFFALAWFRFLRKDVVS